MTVQVVDLGYQPRPWQRECHLARKKHMVLKVHRRAGKTVWAVMEMIDRALRTDRKDWRGAYIAPFYKQAKDIAWGYIERYAGMIPGAEAKQADLQMWLPNGARIALYGADNPDSLRGIYLDLAVVDEYAQIKPSLMPEVISVALMDRNEEDVLMGTVKGYTPLSKAYTDALSRDPALYMARNLTWRETGVFTDAEIQEQRDNMSPEQFRQEFENDDTVASDKQIIPMGLVLPAIGKHIAVDDYEHAAVVLGVDTAFSAVGDRAVIFPRQGLAAFTPEIYRGIKTDAFALRIARMYRDYDADAALIGAGAAAGVIHLLESMGGMNIITVQEGGTPFDSRYGNKRVEMWDAGIKPWLEKGGVLPKDVPGLVEDLCGPCFRPDSQTGKLYMETGDNMKARGLPSPDLGMAFSYTFGVDVRPNRRDAAASVIEERILGKTRRAETDYDDFAGT